MFSVSISNEVQITIGSVFKYPFCYVLCSETENSSDGQVAFVPSVEVLVKALLVISSGIMAAAPSSCIRLIFISHHPCLVGTAKTDAVWKVSHLC